MSHRPLAVMLLALALVAACEDPNLTVVPTPPPTTVPSGSPDASTSPSPSPTTAPSPSAALASPTQAPTPEPTPTPKPTDCPVIADDGRLPSDRLVGVEVGEEAGVDVVTFVFGRPSSPAPPQGASTGHLELATGPFVEGGSGRELDVDGDRVVVVKFEGMTLFDETGAASYDGPKRLPVATTTLRDVVNSEAFEGVSGWYLGFDGPGCVTLARSGDRVSVLFAHGAG